LPPASKANATDSWYEIRQSETRQRNAIRRDQRRNADEIQHDGVPLQFHLLELDLMRRTLGRLCHSTMIVQLLAPTHRQHRKAKATVLAP
jgi:hypothetical protein